MSRLADVLAARAAFEVVFTCHANARATLFRVEKRGHDGEWRCEERAVGA